MSAGLEASVSSPPGQGDGRFDHHARIRLAATTPVKETSDSADGIGLTPREVEVLALVAAGHSNRQIAEALFMSDKTASVHVSRILTKLGVANRGQAAALAHRLGVFEERSAR